MIKFLKKVFSMPTEAEMYDKGRKHALDAMTKATDKLQCAHRLFALADGNFNESAREDAYDKGIRDQLDDMGFSDIYSRN